MRFFSLYKISEYFSFHRHLPLEAKGSKLFIGGESQQIEDGTVSITLVTSGGHVIR